MPEVRSFHSATTMQAGFMPASATHDLVPFTRYEPSVKPSSYDLNFDNRRFSIRLADNHGQRANASLLVERMYARRGYDTGFLGAGAHPHHVTLVASDPQKDTLGTLTVGLDSEAGLLVDGLYQDEVDRVRDEGRSVCEFIKLAVDQDKDSRQVLASIFHIAYIYARLLNQVTDLFIEVNPRHAPFYKRMLGFKQCGGVRVCPRVNAPAVLLRLDFSHADEQIRRLGGQADLGKTERSLYPYFFSEREGAGIARRLRAMN